MPSLHQPYVLTGDEDALHGRHPLRDLLVPLPSIQLSILAPVSPEVGRYDYNVISRPDLIGSLKLGNVWVFYS